MTQMDFEQDQNYWLEKLAGDLVVTSLPLDHRRSTAHCEEQRTTVILH